MRQHILLCVAGLTVFELFSVYAFLVLDNVDTIMDHYPWLFLTFPPLFLCAVACLTWVGMKLQDG